MRDDNDPTNFEPPDADNPPQPKMVFWPRPLNAIEAMLRHRADDACQSLPIIFLDDDGDTLERPADYAGLFAGSTPLEAITPDAVREIMKSIADVVHKPIRERLRLHIIIARELGKGDAKEIEQKYFAACARENLEPERNLT
jgi:hypothetical protein